MAEGIKSAEEKAAEARRGPAGGRRNGPPHMTIGQPGEKSLNFWPSAKRLVGLLRPEGGLVLLIGGLYVASVALAAVGT
jgi:ATP-binding cassette subfamily B protein